MVASPLVRGFTTYLLSLAFLIMLHLIPMGSVSASPRLSASGTDSATTEPIVLLAGDDPGIYLIERMQTSLDLSIFKPRIGQELATLQRITTTKPEIAHLYSDGSYQIAIKAVSPSIVAFEFRNDSDNPETTLAKLEARTTDDATTTTVTGIREGLMINQGANSIRVLSSEPDLLRNPQVGGFRMVIPLQSGTKARFVLTTEDSLEMSQIDNINMDDVQPENPSAMESQNQNTEEAIIPPDYSP